MRYLLGFESGTLFALLLGMFVVCIEVGHWIGKRRRPRYGSATLDQLGTLQAGVLGTLGLILGFFFAVSLGRFDDRRVLVIKEATAINDAYTRSGVLPAADALQSRRLLKRYADLRTELFESRRDEPVFLKALRESEAIHAELWQLTERITHQDSRTVVNLFVMSINDVIDLHIDRVASLSSHVPPLVTAVVVMFAMLGMGAMVFASTARCGQRLGMWFLLACLLSSLLLMIMDLDRPRMGLIPVNHEAMRYVRELMQ